MVPLHWCWHHNRWEAQILTRAVTHGPWWFVVGDEFFPQLYGDLLNPYIKIRMNQLGVHFVHVTIVGWFFVERCSGSCFFSWSRVLGNGGELWWWNWAMEWQKFVYEKGLKLQVWNTHSKKHGIFSVSPHAGFLPTAATGCHQLTDSCIHAQIDFTTVHGPMFRTCSSQKTPLVRHFFSHLALQYARWNHIDDSLLVMGPKNDETCSTMWQPVKRGWRLIVEVDLINL